MLPRNLSFLRSLLPARRRHVATADRQGEPGRLLQLAWRALDQGRPLQAAQQFAAVLQAGPDARQAAAALLGAGLAWQETGDLTQACEAFEQFLDRCPRSHLLPVVIKNLIACREELARREERARRAADHCHLPWPSER